MTDTSPAMPILSDFDLPDRMTQKDVDQPNRYTEQALLDHKRKGLELSTKARWVGLSVVAVMLPFLNPSWEMLYYEALLLVLALNAWAIQRVGRVGRSKSELALIFLDLAVMTVALVVPNPFSSDTWPTAMSYRFENFQYMYVLLIVGSLAFSWRTILALGHWTVAMWSVSLGLMWMYGTTDPALTAAAVAAFGTESQMATLLDPNSLNFDLRIQQMVVFLICAYTLALSVRRFNRLLLGNAALERERANLSRYFSPNVVEELSQNDEPLKQIRSHNVGVLFVDIVGFTHMAAHQHPRAVIETLRIFHARMEAEVFRHAGTLDKYLGDGLMATFGTPRATERDATNVLACAKAMVQVVAQWNTERAAAGEAPIQASFGVHYGPVVLGDIGANRLEFAVIGNTVNVANQLEKLTRILSADLVVSDDVCAQVTSEGGVSALAGLVKRAPQQVRGIDQPVPVWTL